MSRYCVVKTIFKDGIALVDALMETGQWTRQQIEVHDTPQHLRGYQNDRRQETANIIIRKQHVGRMSNDIGFVFADGSYQAIVSEYDKNKYGDKWIGQLKANYAFHKIRRDQESCGRTVSRERQSNGRQRITVTGYR